MVVVIITPWYSENMGYVENKLPKALCDLGCDVHLITSDMQIYATDPERYKVYEPFLGPAIVPVGKKEVDGYVISRLPHYFTKYGIGIKGLQEELIAINPNVVYLFEINTEHTLQVVKYQPALNYKIFSESRLHLSIYTPPKTILERLRHHFRERLVWKQAGKSFEKCYPVAPDVLYVICEYFGQDKKKCKLSSLAVDTNIFNPVASEQEQHKRGDLRKRLGYNENDIVCIYTGRFAEDKGPLVLAKAIDLLHQSGDVRFKGLFVGTGDEAYENSIRSMKGCQIHPFVASSELVIFYQSAEIGVWPKQESTSQLDALACGLPIIISSNVEDTERIKDCGLSYQHENPTHLASQIKSLESLPIRTDLGSNGYKKVREFYSWEYIAKARLSDFNESKYKV